MCVACWLLPWGELCVGAGSDADLLGGSRKQFVLIKGCFSQCAVLPIAHFEKHLYLS